MQCASNRQTGGKNEVSPEDLNRFPLNPVRSGHPPAIRTLVSPLGWFTLPEGQWIAAKPDSGLAGLPQSVAVRIPDRQMRVSVFSASFPKNSYNRKEMEIALGFLFQLDPKRDSSTMQAHSGYQRTFYLPPSLSPSPLPTSSANSPAMAPRSHAGLAIKTDTTLVWIHLESTDSTSMANMRVWIDTVKWSEASSQGSAKASDFFIAAIENTLGLKATEDSNYVSAMEHYSKAFALDSLNPRYLANIAAMDQALKQSPRGIQRLESHASLLQYPGASEMYGVLGGLYEEIGDYIKAKQCALKALEKDPDNREWLINLSDALWGLGDKVQSKNVLLGRYAKSPDFRLSIYLAGTYLGLEEYENARQVLEKASELGRPDTKSVEYMLRALIGLKEFGTAQAYFHSVSDSISPSGMVHFLLGVTSFNLKQYRFALKEVQAALASDPGQREAQELSSQITALLGGKSNQILRTVMPPLKTRLHLREDRESLKDSAVKLITRNFPMTLLEQHIVFAWSPGTNWHKTRHQLFYIPDGKRLMMLLNSLKQTPSGIFMTYRLT